MILDYFREKSLDYTQAFYQAKRSFDIDPNQKFVDVKNRIGLMASAHYAQLFFSNHKRYKRFRRELDLHSQKLNALNKNYDVLVVTPPRGLLPESARQLMLRQSLGLATSAGFDYVSHAQLNTDRVLHGAHRLQKLIEEKKKAGRKLIIVSHSYGSAFVRVMLDRSRSEDLVHVKGWMNLSGFIFGSPLYHCSDKKSLFNFTSPSQRTFSSEQQYFRTPLNTHHLKVVHFIGMKNNELLSAKELRQRERLKAWGPSDGLIPFSCYRNLEQVVVPVLDQGHTIDLSHMSLTFVRCLSAMVSTLPVSASPKKTPQPYLPKTKSSLEIL